MAAARAAILPLTELTGALRECGIYPNRGYGAVRETTGSKGDIYLPPARYAEPQWATVEAAKLWVIERLREQGVTIAV